MDIYLQNESKSVISYQTIVIFQHDLSVMENPVRVAELLMVGKHCLQHLCP